MRQKNNNNKEHDEPILKHLHDVRVIFTGPESTNTTQYPQPTPMGFVLEFHFTPNPFFTNTVLTKSYKMKCEPDEDDPFSFEGPEIVSTSGCKIDWKKGKNITQKAVLYFTGEAIEDEFDEEDEDEEGTASLTPLLLQSCSRSKILTKSLMKTDGASTLSQTASLTPLLLQSCSRSKILTKSLMKTDGASTLSQTASLTPLLLQSCSRSKILTKSLMKTDGASTLSQTASLTPLLLQSCSQSKILTKSLMKTDGASTLSQTASLTPLLLQSCSRSKILTKSLMKTDGASTLSQTASLTTLLLQSCSRSKILTKSLMKTNGFCQKISKFQKLTYISVINKYLDD
ncbi:predicted protein [Nematostella vectensis]|uniref:Uncharacterized protein n=1 Tax=Nematostella vectensis TaxID=45351 RepID=A7T9K4_NEMVE|nr:predicted protein [Nematostella vectensis]|eukprot:XP_001619420.1 hypothetical protein NEMVEDRAFT_v1g224199 [Nematostella vectensis]